MSQYYMLVSVSRSLEGDDLVREVDRIVYPHIKDGKLDYYQISHRETPSSSEPYTYSYIDLDGHWESQFMPDEVSLGGEPGVHLPNDQWEQQVKEWCESVKYRRVIVCRCHD